MKFRLPLLLLLVPVPALAAEVDRARAESFSLHLAQLETIRKDCITTASAMKCHCNVFGVARWNDGIAASFDDRQIGDFFAGTYNFAISGLNLGACCTTFPYLLGRDLAAM